MIGKRYMFVWVIQILDGGRNTGFQRSLFFLLLAFCTSFQRGEDRNGRVRVGWGRIRI